MATTTLRPISVDEYYADTHVQARIVEQCGGTGTAPATAAYVAALAADGPEAPTWEHALRVPPDQLPSLWARRSDIARSLWDTRVLVFLLELDYQNIDAPAEPFLHPADVFLKLEPAYQAATTVFSRLSLPLRAIATGRGYHFVGHVPLDDPLVEELAHILPDTPAWYAGVDRRRPSGVTAPLTERQARAAAGLGCLAEHAAHGILAAATDSLVPVMFSGTIVGSSNLVGRESVSIDFSHFGDPLDTRHVRTAFSTYQWHRLRSDIFGALAATRVPPAVAIPRGRRSLMTVLTTGRELAAARAVARRVRAEIPVVTAGLRRLLADYRTSALAAAHREFFAELGTERARPPALDTAAVAPCITSCLTQPNDLLLRPEHLQHLVRGLLSAGWTAAQIASQVRSVYEADHGWGDRFTARMDARTRAEFDVRVFASLVATGADSLVDFNCVSAQEKNICPRVGCPHDLRVDRDRLAARWP